MNERIPILLCGGSQGRAVIFGFVDEAPVKGKQVVLYNARMVLRWTSACGGLLGLAAKGPKDDARVTHVVSRLGDTDWQQWIEVTPEAAEAFAKWPAF